MSRAMTRPTTWHIPTLADVPREDWPDDLVIIEPDPSTGDEAVRVRCRCLVPHRLEDVFDLRAAPAGFKLPPVLCTHCLHHAALGGHFAWRALAVALGCTDATVLASHAAVDAEHALGRSLPHADARHDVVPPALVSKPRRA